MPATRARQALVLLVEARRVVARRRAGSSAMASGAPSAKSSGSVTDAAPLRDLARDAPAAGRRDLRLSTAATARGRRSRVERRRRSRSSFFARGAPLRLDARARRRRRAALGVVRGDRRRRCSGGKARGSLVAAASRGGGSSSAVLRRAGPMAPTSVRSSPSTSCSCAPRRRGTAAGAATSLARGRTVQLGRRARPRTARTDDQRQPDQLLAQQHAERRRRLAGAGRLVDEVHAPGARVRRQRAASRRAAPSSDRDVVGLDDLLHGARAGRARRAIATSSRATSVELRRPQASIDSPPRRAVHSARHVRSPTSCNASPTKPRARAMRLEELCTRLRRAAPAARRPESHGATQRRDSTTAAPVRFLAPPEGGIQ